MPKTPLISLLIPLPLATTPAYAEAPASSPEGTAETFTSDYRQFVTMPDQARTLMRQDMLAHLSSLSEIIGHLASNDLAAASEVAESRMGKSTMGKHRASGMGPGRFMLLEMRQIGWDMHESATKFSQIAKKGSATEAYAALQKVTASCIACHNSYRTR